jgi:hypothetical protein
MDEPPSPPAPKLDAAGRYHAHGTISAITVGVYVVLILLIYFFVIPLSSNPYVVYLLVVGTAFLLVRYASTGYSIDDAYLHARRILGGRRVPLSEIRKIEFMALRDLSPTGFFGSWGYRGRMWSPFIGAFDAIYTDPVGILVTGGPYPLFISPRGRAAFARELSRRVRSYTGALAVDAGFEAPGLSM